MRSRNLWCGRSSDMLQSAHTGPWAACRTQWPWPLRSRRLGGPSGRALGGFWWAWAARVLVRVPGARQPGVGFSFSASLAEMALGCHSPSQVRAARGRAGKTCSATRYLPATLPARWPSAAAISGCWAALSSHRFPQSPQYTVVPETADAAATDRSSPGPPPVSIVPVVAALPVQRRPSKHRRRCPQSSQRALGRRKGRPATPHAYAAQSMQALSADAEAASFLSPLGESLLQSFALPHARLVSAGWLAFCGLCGCPVFPSPMPLSFPRP